MKGYVEEKDGSKKAKIRLPIGGPHRPLFMHLPRLPPESAARACLDGSGTTVHQ